MTHPASAERYIMARVINYRFFHGDITPHNLYMDLAKAAGIPWYETCVAKWNRKLHGPTPGYAICWGCKEHIRSWQARGIVDACSYCSHHFSDMAPGPQAMHLSTSHDAKLLLYTFSWVDQDRIYFISSNYKRVYKDHGILPQSDKQRLSQEDVQPACDILLNQAHVTLLPPSI